MARACCKYVTVSLVPVAALFLAVIFTLGIFILPILYTELVRKYEYGIVIDAGSSHTEIILYQFEVPINQKENIQTIAHHKDDRHLDSYLSDPSKAGEVVTSLVSNVNESLEYIDVQHSLYKDTPIYLGATAGMRLLHMEHPNASDDIFNSVIKEMKSSGFSYKSASIITGIEEAAGGWVTANYLMPEPVGSLDMGGASTEIAFEVNPTATNSSYYVKEKIFNESHSIYARSYLCYGHKEAHGRFLSHLIKINNNTIKNVSNPCLALGVNISHSMEVINTSCARDPIALEVFGSILPLPPHIGESDTATFNGTGDLEQCYGIIKEVFNFSACDPEVNCESKKFEYPPINGSFVGFSGFFFVARFINIENTTFNQSYGLQAHINATCKDLKVVNKSNEACFGGMFMGHMMEEGFGMNTTTSRNWSVSFKRKVNNKPFGWAMGYIINQAAGYSDTPYQSTHPYSAVDLVIGMIVLTILCAIFVIFFFLTFYACKKVLMNSNGYQSLS